MTDELVARLRELVQATDRYRRALAANLGIGPGEATAMSELLDHEPLSPSSLAQRLTLSPAGVTGLLDRLEAAGHAVRLRHPADRRSVLVELTPSGRRATTVMLDLFAADVAAGLSGSDPLNAATLVAGLTGISARLRLRTADPSGLAAEMRRGVPGYRAVPPARRRPTVRPEPSAGKDDAAAPSS